MTIEICIDENWVPYIEDACAVTNKVYKNGGYYWLTIATAESALPSLLERFFEAGIKYREELHDHRRDID